MWIKNCCLSVDLKGTSVIDQLFEVFTPKHISVGSELETELKHVQTHLYLRY